MNEDFISYLWKNRLFNTNNCLVDNEEISLIQPGKENYNSGPDFFNSKIKLGSTIWAGNVEIHVRSSDWFRHNHQFDERYNNIILHVVYEHDQEVFRRSGENIPTLSLKNKFDESLYYRYQDFIRSKNWVPCINLLGEVRMKIKRTVLNRMLFNRLNNKAIDIEKKLVLSNHSWEIVFNHNMITYFGFKLNNHAFELLAKSIPFECLKQTRKKLIPFEALLFGQSGLLQKSQNGIYPALLLIEYNKLKKKYSLQPIDPSLWKFLRLRPNNFPTIRISQLTHLLFQNENLYKKAINSNSLKELYDIFDVNCSDYWFNHFLFGVESSFRNKILGKQSIQLIIINTVIPFMFAYGKVHNNNAFTQKALDFLRELPAEKNSVIKKFSRIGFESSSAFDSQALLQMKSLLCDNKKCLKCQIGNYLLKRQ